VRAIRLALACLALAACGTEEAVTEADKALFVRVADLALFGLRYDNAEALETFSKSRHLDGAYELSYRFRSPEGARQPLFLHVGVNVARRDSDATLAEGAEKVGLLIAFKKDGVEEREVPGVQSGKLTVLVKDGRPIGNVFSARQGTKTYLLIMSGLYVEDAALWHKLVEPRLERFRSYSPQANG